MTVRCGWRSAHKETVPLEAGEKLYVVTIILCQHTSSSSSRVRCLVSPGIVVIVIRERDTISGGVGVYPGLPVSLPVSLSLSLQIEDFRDTNDITVC